MSERWLRSGRRRRLLVASSVVALCSACGTPATTTGPGDSPTSDDVGARLEATLVERDHLTAQDAACIRAQVEGVYTPDELKTIIDSTVVGLHSARWAGYSYAYLDCVLAEELGLEGPADRPPSEAP